MATIVNGTNMILYVDDSDGADLAGATKVLAAAQTCSLTITTDAPECTDKGTTTAGGNDQKEYVGLSTSWTIDADGLYSENAGGGIADLATLFVPAYGQGTTAGTGGDSPTVAGYPRRIWVKFLGNTAGDYYHGAGFITSISASGGNEDAATYSVSIQGTGVLTLV